MPCNPSLWLRTLARVETTASTMNLLLVEDSERLRTTLTRGLSSAGFVVETAADGIEAEGFLFASEYDLLVLDLMLPRLDGLDVLRGLTRARMRPRTLVLSARDQVNDRVEALDAGADDYLVKPFAFDELLARLHALLRRPVESRSSVLQADDIRVDLRARMAQVDGQTLPLTPREFSLLALLMHHRGRVFARHEILERLAGSHARASDRSIEVLVFGLRRKLSSAGVDGLIKTRRGAGYLIP